MNKNNRLNKLLFILISTSIAMNLVACKSNPSETIITNKNRDITEHIESVAKDIDKTTYETDKVFKSIDVNNSNINISIDAKLFEPTGEFSVTEVKTQNFSIAQIEKIVKILFDNRTLYKPWAESKADIEKEIIKLKKIISEEDKSNFEKEFARSQLTYAEQRYKSAPSDVIKEPAVLEFEYMDSKNTVNISDEEEYKSDNDFEYEYLNIRADYGEDTFSSFDVYNSYDGANSWMLYSRDVKRNFDGYESFELPLKDYINSGFSYSDALNIANTTIQDMDIDLVLSNSSLISYILIEPRIVPPAFLGTNQENEDVITLSDIEDSDSQAYKFYYTRAINDVPITYDKVISLGQNSDDFSKCLYYEVASIVIDKNGIVEFEYRAPYVIGNTINENTKIIDIDETLKIFETHMKNKYSSQILDSKISIKIHSIVLGLSRIKNPDGRLLLVPTYDFLGNLNIENNNSITSDMLNPAVSFATINAIDGSVIDKAMGY